MRGPFLGSRLPPGARDPKIVQALSKEQRELHPRLSSDYCCTRVSAVRPKQRGAKSGLGKRAREHPVG